MKNRKVVNMFLKKYYVNKIILESEPVPYGQHVIGLYRSGRWKAEGSFSGWYGSEYRKGAKLLAYFIIESSLVVTKGEKHLKEIIYIRPVRIKKLMINSIYSEHKLIAKDDHEAVRKFLSEQRMELFN